MRQRLEDKKLVRIGITCSWEEGSHRLKDAYPAAIWEVGGVPFLLPSSPGLADSHLDYLDGIILAGGADLDPWAYGQEPVAKLGRITPERDTYEIELARRARARNIPILGICRGIQTLAAAFGGSLHQHLETDGKHWQDAPAWYPTHGISLVVGSRLEAILGPAPARVNSFHHQGVNRLPPGFTASATATDGVIEAIESEGEPWILGVQWHPEDMVSRYPLFAGLFRALVEEAERTSRGT